MDHPSKNMEDIGAKVDLHSGVLAQVVLEEKNVSISLGDCFCDI